MNLAPDALRIARKGTPIFPCSAADKSPLTKAGFKDASSDEKMINRWWGKWPDALIGMPTGKVTGCTVVDIDCGKADSDDPKLREEGEAAAAWWQEHKVAFSGATIVQTRSGGLHVYCRYNGERNTQGGIHRGVDRRGEGGYVIIPPSPGYALLHQSPRSEWPVAPGNADGSGELGLMRYGMDMATMGLRTGKDGESAARQMGEVLVNLLIEPDEYHKNLQRMAFILAMWFDSPMPRIKAFLEGVTEAASQSGRIDMALYRKHMTRIARMAEWYAAKAEVERSEEAAVRIAEYQDQIVVKVIRNASASDLADLQALINKRKKEIGK